MSELLGNVRRNPNLLIPVENREIVSFTISLARPMGVKRSAGSRSFIDSVLQTLDDFYGDVVEHLKEWRPPTPKLRKEASRDSEDDGGAESTTDAAGELADSSGASDPSHSPDDS